MRKSQLLGMLLATATVLGVAANASAQRSSKRGRGSAARTTQTAAEGVVNLNTATVQQLAFLPGVGPAKAEAIVRTRQRRPFANVNQIVRVRGIGRATLRRLRPYLTVRGDTTLTRPVGRTSTKRGGRASTPRASGR